jgi:hypothetical protein
MMADERGPLERKLDAALLRIWGVDPPVDGGYRGDYVGGAADEPPADPAAFEGTDQPDEPPPASAPRVVLDYLFDQWRTPGNRWTLPVNSAERKEIPVDMGCLGYFPAALAAVAAWSYMSNQKHNPGQGMHWAQHKSTDHAECIARHKIDRGDVRNDPRAKLVELTAQAWRALAELQIFAQSLGAPVPPGADPPGGA